MFRSANPLDFIRTPTGRAATVVLLGGLTAAACGSSDSSEGQTSAGTTAATSSAEAAPPSDPDCQPGVETPDGFCVIQQFGAPAFEDYASLNGRIDNAIAVGQKVMVRCLHPEAIIPSAEGGWYELGPTEELAGYEVPANTFENGDVAGVPLNRVADPRIPVC